ncbi:hypothetical protein HK097_000065 [Rhizophlyctis rosea]|uniref:Uncharacterized protein n=1 Tax=Rhizophlyctis rosea TaxID=64517 RepID=A0AAD5SMU0_9FUNG|nr:hypothetical protein HK097_000065 [Rhizophlyctis rosea]
MKVIVPAVMKVPLMRGGWVEEMVEGDDASDEKGRTGMGETVILEEPSFFSIIAEGGLDALKQLEAQYGSEYLHQKGRNGRTILHYACIKLPDRSVPKNDPNRNIIEYLVTSQEHKPLSKLAALE